MECSAATVSFVLRDVVDAQCRRYVVVSNRALTLAIQNRCVGGVAEIHEEGFIRLVKGVALNLHSDRSGHVAGVESKRSSRDCLIISR